MKAILYMSEPINEESGTKTGIKSYNLYLPNEKLMVSEYAGYVHLLQNPKIELVEGCAESITEVNIDFPDGQTFFEWARAETIGKETARRVIQELLQGQKIETAA